MKVGVVCGSSGRGQIWRSPVGKIHYLEKGFMPLDLEAPLI